MSFLNAFLTARQQQVWDMFRRGTKQSDIAKQIGTTRQALNQTLNQAKHKMTQALLNAAKIHALRIETLDSQNGYVTGYSPQAKTQITIIYTLRHGLQAWFHHEASECADCDQYDICITTLKEEALRRGIKISKEESRLEPSRLADVLFSRIQGTPGGNGSES